MRKEQKGRHKIILNEIGYCEKHLSTLRSVQEEGKTCKLLFSQPERDYINSIDVPTFSIKRSQMILNKALMLQHALDHIVESFIISLSIINGGIQSYVVNPINIDKGGGHAQAKAKDLRTAAFE